MPPARWPAESWPSPPAGWPARPDRRAALASAAGQPPAALIDRVLQAVDGWLDGQAHDDIAVLAVRASAPG
ncbi:hypothetical protein C7C45_00330 [Micromonospora arborensis]|uniref:PPM-type phosphatase domain-containing protein n=1 Tax=Micromonospora arborensis TaxID=2116518 RepID=A0A318NR34_9ACTN|nr:SpoIIE family protein phosphatase [Micromonospora arborensis]PYC76477.1 hypothetical protein C7C45_00330 [Micromonospora arborensis]